MQSTRHDSRRRHPGQSAAHAAAGASSSAAVFETLESRQLMSVAAPSLDPTGAMLAADPAGTASYAPLVVTNSNGAVNPAADAPADVTGVTPGDGDDVPPSTGGDDTAEAQSLWDRVKGAAKWVKNHVTATLHSIGIKGTF